MRVALLVLLMVTLGVLCACLSGCSGASAEPVGSRSAWRAPSEAAATAAGGPGDAAAAAFEAMGDLASAPPAPESAVAAAAGSPSPAPAEQPKPVAQPNPADDPDGSLDEADLVAGDGRYYDAVALELQPAAEGAEPRLRVVVVATAFVPCVGVITGDNPSGVWGLPEGDVAYAWLDVSGENLAECTVVVTSGHSGRAGRYYLALAEGDGDFAALTWGNRTQIGIDKGQPDGDPSAPDWQGIDLPEGYGANWETGIGPEQVMVFGLRPFSRDGRYMSLTGNVRFLHHGRTDVWLPRGQIDVLLWLLQLSPAVVESITTRPAPAAADIQPPSGTTEAPMPDASDAEENAPAEKAA